MAILQNTGILMGSSGVTTEDGPVLRSLRFNNPDTTYLKRTPSSAGNQKTWSFSCWVKKCESSTKSCLFSQSTDGSNRFILHQWYGLFYFYSNKSGASCDVGTTYRFVDHSDWYHVLYVFDTTQGTAADRTKIYVNGVEQTLTYNTSPSENVDYLINSTGQHRIGNEQSGTTTTLDGYLANVHFIDGAAKIPSDFTETDATTGQLIPKTYTGSYGTNGFWLKFADNSDITAATLGKDSSGNGNNYTPTNLQVRTGAPTAVSAATGALPFYNTSDTYGATKGSGYRTDSSAGTTDGTGLIFALPGDVLTDEHDHVNTGSSAHTVTVSGNTAVSTTKSKFYGSSIYFDGTGDYLRPGDSADFAFGTGDFTVECWIYATRHVNYQAWVDTRESGNSVNSGWVIASNAGGNFYVWSNGLNTVLDGGSLALNKWHHHCYIRDSGTHKYYVNGILKGTSTESRDYTDDKLTIGATSYAADENVQGYMNDIRLYKGVVKYTNNFNPVFAEGNAYVGTQADSLVDAPGRNGTDTGAGGEVSGNYATFSPFMNGGTLTRGNLHATSGTQKRITSDFVMTSGKWYYEFTLMQGTIQQFGIGSMSTAYITSSPPGDSPHVSYIILTNGSAYHQGSTFATGLPSIAKNDIVGVAFDADSRKTWWSLNGSWMGTGSPNPATGADPLVTASASYAPYAPTVGAGGADAVNCAFNAGQRPFAYTAPSGFKALCTTNLPDPTIAKPGGHFNAILYTGNGSTKAVSGFGFDPDWVWVKRRDSGNGHNIFDQVRGATKYISSSSTNGEGTGATELTSFDTDGFTYGSAAGGNANTGTYVSWGWEADTTTSGTWGANSKAYSRRTNSAAGISIIKFVGDGSTAIPGTGAIPHGLSGKPDLVISKRLDTTGNWWTGFDCFDGTFDVLKLESTAAKSDETYDIYDADEVSNWGCPDGSDQVYYVIKSVPGYSKVGSYAGTGAEGHYIDFGFRARWILIRGIDFAGESWFIFDTSRDTQNEADARLLTNVNNAENEDQDLGDIMSSGLRIMNGWDGINGSSKNYLYYAIAEAPFKYSRAR